MVQLQRLQQLGLQCSWPLSSGAWATRDPRPHYDSSRNQSSTTPWGREVLPLCSNCPELTFRPHIQPCKTKIRVEERWDSMLELISQCWRNDACPAWAQGLPCTKQLQHVTYSGSPGSSQFGVEQCKIPRPIFFRLEARRAARSAKHHHCALPHHSLSEGMTLGSPKPFLSH